MRVYRMRLGYASGAPGIARLVRAQLACIWLGQKRVVGAGAEKGMENLPPDLPGMPGEGGAHLRPGAPRSKGVGQPTLAPH